MVRLLRAGDSTAALTGEVMFDCGVGILAAAAFSGVPLSSVRHLLLSGTGPDRLDPALAAAPPAGLRIHPPGSGPVALSNGRADEIAPGAWLLDNPPLLHAPDPLPEEALRGLTDVALTVPNPGLAGRSAAHRVLVTGGSRSGKSQLAEELLAGRDEVVYLATGAVPDGSDPEWTRRIKAHRDRRPASWSTVETLDVQAVLGQSGPPVLLDGLGTWLAGAMDEAGVWDGRPGADETLADSTVALLDAWRDSRRDVVAVTDEVGSGVVPGTHSGRRFRDALGRINAAVAADSDEVWLVTAGIGQRLR